MFYVLYIYYTLHVKFYKKKTFIFKSISAFCGWCNNLCGTNECMNFLNSLLSQTKNLFLNSTLKKPILLYFDFEFIFYFFSKSSSKKTKIKSNKLCHLKFLLENKHPFFSWCYRFEKKPIFIRQI